MAIEPTWRQFLALGFAFVVLALFLTEEAAEVLTLAIGTVAVAIMFRCARTMDRPGKEAWSWFGSGGALIISGNILLGILSPTIDDLPFPSPADFFFIAGYLCLFIGTIRLVRMRTRKLERAHLYDSLLVSSSLGVVAWAALLSPYVRDTTVPLADRLVNTGYSGLTLALLTAIVFLIVGPGWRNPSFYFLVGSFAAIFISDLLLTMSTAGIYEGGFIAPISSLSYVLGAVGILHPSAKVLTDSPPRQTQTLRFRRVAILAAPLLVTPAVLVFEIARDLTVDLPVIVTASVVLSGLVVARLVELVRATEEIALRERALHEAGLTLVAATTDEEIHVGAITAATALMGNERTIRVSLAIGPEESMTVIAATGSQALEATGTVVRTSDLAPPFLDGIRQRQLVYVPASPPVDLPRRAIIGVQSGTISTALIPLGTQGDLRGILIVSSPADIPTPVLRSLEALSSEVSLAMESALLARDLHRREDERRFRALIEHSSDIVCVAGQTGGFSFMSPAAQHLLGFSEEALTAMPGADLVHPDDLRRVQEMMVEVRAAVGTTSSAEARISLADGSYLPFELIASNMTDQADIRGILINARNVTERKHAEEQLAHSEARFRALVQNSSDVVAIVNPTGIITYVSPSVTKVLHYQSEELLGGDLFTMLPVEESSRLEGDWAALLSGSTESFSTEVRFVDQHNRPRAIDLVVTDLRDEPAVNGLVINARDVTVNRVLEDDLAYQSRHDTLTGLGNRTMFVEQLGEALTWTDEDLEALVVLVVDLDDFKAINEQLGHSIGDHLLRITADRLRSCLRTRDIAVRLGSDEFAVLLHQSATEQEVLSVTDRIHAVIAEPVTINGHHIVVTASIGVANARHREEVLPEKLMRNADMALYLAKEKGKAQSQVFEEDLRAQVFEHLALRSALEGAISNHQLVLHYQPIVSLTTLDIVGVEALVRWQHPERGLLMPDGFISLAEETGLVVPLGRWVLEEACQQLRSWQLELGEAAPSSVAVNVAAGQLDETFAADVLDALDRFGLEPTCLHLEVTERTMVDGTNNEQTLRDLRTAGVMVGVDDFGTGYSSLGYLQQFPFDVIKIDKSFVHALQGPAPDLRLITSIIELAHQMRAHPLAEGIETPEQLEILQGLGCVLGQGYLFARPMPVNLLDLTLTGKTPSRHVRDVGTIQSDNHN